MFLPLTLSDIFQGECCVREVEAGIHASDNLYSLDRVVRVPVGRRLALPLVVGVGQTTQQPKLRLL